MRTPTKRTAVPQEPEKLVIDKQSTLIHILTWYSQNKTYDDFKVYVLSYLKNKFDADQIKKVNLLENHAFHTYGALCRLQHRNHTINMELPNIENHFLEKIKNVFIKKAVVEKIAPKKIDNYDKVLETIDLAVDKLFEDGISFIAFESKPAFNKVRDYLVEYENQMIKDFENGGFDKKQLVKFQKFKEATLNNLKQATKTKAVSKRVSPAKQVIKVKFSNTQIENIKTLFPIDVLGKNKMYVYDSKSRKLTMYIAKGLFGFTGTTLQNFDVEKSKTKMIRKPDVFFKDCKKMSEFNERYKNLTTVESVPNGRFNETSCILMVN